MQERRLSLDGLPHVDITGANAMLRSALDFFEGGARPPTEVTVAYIDGHREFGIEPNCRTLQMAPSNELLGESPAALGAVGA